MLLGRTLKASTLGIISSAEQLCSGYLDFNSYGCGNVYIFSSEEFISHFCKVIAMVYVENSDNPKLILTHDDKIYYEPDIRKKLSRLNLNIKKIICLYEKSCGAVVFRRLGEDFRVLLVKNRNGKYWGFPKGHIEDGENEVETAKREILEETGLNVIIYNDFRETGIYRPYGKTTKKVVFFLAESLQSNVHIQLGEIDDFEWVSFNKAKEVCRYENDIRVLDKAQNYIHNKCLKNGVNG